MPFLRFGQMIRKHAGYFFDTFLTGGKNTTVAGDDAKVTVDDNRIYEAELTEGGAELIDLLRRVCPGVVLVRYQFVQRNELKFGGGSHRTSPHSANFSKPPISLIYARAISTISP